MRRDVRYCVLEFEICGGSNVLVDYVEGCRKTEREIHCFISTGGRCWRTISILSNDGLLKWRLAAGANREPKPLKGARAS